MNPIQTTNPLISFILGRLASEDLAASMTHQPVEPTAPHEAWATAVPPLVGRPLLDSDTKERVERG